MSIIDTANEGENELDVGQDKVYRNERVQYHDTMPLAELEELDCRSEVASTTFDNLEEECSEAEEGSSCNLNNLTRNTKTISLNA